GLLLMSTVRLVPRRIGPIGGNGMGGTGGGPLGGCFTWACGMPRAMLVSVAAGNGPIALARPATALFIFSSSAPPTTLARAAPGSAIVLRTDVACCAACAILLMAWATWSTFFSASAILCLRSLGGSGLLGSGGGAFAVAALRSSLAPL